MSRRALAVLVPLAALSACASAPEGDDRSSLLLARSNWINRSLDGVGSDDSVVPHACGEQHNPAVRPSDPWLGTIGLRRLLPGNCEYGVGVCVPNPFDAHAQDTSLPNRVGLGCWIKLDF